MFWKKKGKWFHEKYFFSVLNVYLISYEMFTTKQTKKGNLKWIRLFFCLGSFDLVDNMLETDWHHTRNNVHFLIIFIKLFLKLFLSFQLTLLPTTSFIHCRIRKKKKSMILACNVCSREKSLIFFPSPNEKYKFH